MFVAVEVIELLINKYEKKCILIKVYCIYELKRIGIETLSAHAS